MTLEEIRCDIDKKDNELKRLFVERMELSEKVVRFKAETGNAIYKPDREEEVIERLTEGVSEDIREEYRSFVKHILLLSRKYQYRRMSDIKGAYKAELEDGTEGISAGHNRVKILIGSNEKKCDPVKALTIISEYGIGISEMSFSEEEGILSLELKADLMQKELLILLYQLSEESEGLRIVGSNTAE